MKLEKVKKDTKNRSVTYILPLILTGKEFNKKAIVNSYLYSIHAPQFNVDIIKGLFIELSYEFESKDTFKFDSDTKYMIDVDANTFLVYYEAPQRLWSDINLLVRGKYSKISAVAKELIKEFYNISVENKIYQIIHKTLAYKKLLEQRIGQELPENAELGSSFDIETEVFDKKIKKEMKDE